MEMMVVIAIVAVLGAAAVFTMRQANRVNLAQATKYILHDIRHARTEATKREETATIIFNPVNNSYTYTISNTAITKTVLLNDRYRDSIWILPVAPGGGADPPPQLTFQFGPRGIANGPLGLGPGMLYLTDRDGFENPTGKFKVYRIRAQAAGLTDTHMRTFDIASWADYQ